MSIKLLSNDVINKIAAGEVVERPLSIVKELVENSIDAGATKIDVYIENGGKKKIVVKDDGSGVSREDAPLCLVSHATSKISSSEDLFSISTMGFRGEALSSISSVSRFEMISSLKDSGGAGVRFGVNLEENDGSFFIVDRQGLEPGTTVTVRDLFFNIPARLAFLKSEKSEQQAIVETLEGLSIAHPQVSLSLYQSGKTLFQSLGVQTEDDRFGKKALRSRLAPVYKTATLSDMVYGYSSSRYLDLELMISKPSVGYSNSRGILFFVNSRQVVNKNLRSTFLRGYQSYLLKGKYPCGVCLMNIDSTLVDVNVSPSKNQVRFQYEKETLSFLIKTVQEVLRKGDWLLDKISDPSQLTQSAGFKGRSAVVPVNIDSLSLFPSSSKTSYRSTEVLSSSSSFVSNSPSWSRSRSIESNRNFILDKKDLRKNLDQALNVPELEFNDLSLQDQSFYSKTSEAIEDEKHTGSSLDSTGVIYGARSCKTDSLDTGAISSLDDFSESLSETYSDLSSHKNIVQKIDWLSMRYLGSYANCYLFLEYMDQLVVIDQHAFHERILYEKMIQDPTYLNQKQQLLVFESVSCDPAMIEKAQTYKSQLSSYGFGFHIVNDSIIEISEIPVILADSDISEVFIQVLEGIDTCLDCDGTFGGSKLSKKIYETIACHSAVRSGENLDERQVKSLFKQASEVGFCWTCPHGRNCFKFFDKTQVEKWFDRI